MYKVLIIYFVFLFINFTQSYTSDYIQNSKEKEIELYNKSIKLFNKKKYKESIKIFQRIEDLYPFSYIAMKAKLLSSISYYRIGKYINSASEIDDYIEIYSRNSNKDLSYAHYLRILSYYMQIKKIHFGQKKISSKVLELCTNYINSFPKNKYTKEIEKKLELVTEHILAKEYSISKFYLKRGEYLPAINRLQKIITNKNSKYFFKSINYLIIAYSALGLDYEAKQYKNMLLNKKF